MIYIQIRMIYLNKKQIGDDKDVRNTDWQMSYLLINTYDSQPINESTNCLNCISFLVVQFIIQQNV